MIIQTRDQKISLASEKWCINSLCVFVRTCICFFGKKANVDGSQPSVGNSIAFSSVVILSINCFGLKPISAAWLFVALKSRDSRKTCLIQFTVIFHEKKKTQWRQRSRLEKQLIKFIQDFPHKLKLRKKLRRQTNLGNCKLLAPVYFNPIN